ncbi:MAG: hypothetical protein PHD76_03030 [Methylacidiphilales bacterium]|nr:hypothetical protein [Candidatus Methylacidiphilales bacterium]
MKLNSSDKNFLNIHFAGISTVTRRMVRERAWELAVINGFQAHEASKSHWEQAKQELTSEPGTNAKVTSLASTPESGHQYPPPGSTGDKIPAIFRDEGNSEARSGSARPLDEGDTEGGQDETSQTDSIQRHLDE